MAKLSSSSGLFAKRGNPWLTQREGLKDYQREALQAFENPDLECFTRATKAQERHEKGSDTPILPKPDLASLARQKAMILLKLHGQHRKKGVRVKYKTDKY